MTQYYKVLSATRQNINGGNMTWEPGVWYKVEGELKMCSNGFHLTDKPYKWMKSLDDVVWYPEYRGEVLEGTDDKICVAEARITEPAPVPDWLTSTREFVASLNDFPFFQLQGEPLPHWKVFEENTWSAARNAARNAAGNAAWSAAWSAARSAAGNAAWSAAWSAARNAAGNAAWNASLLACCLVMQDVIDPKHLAHAQERWEAYKRGFGVLCDVNGVLYVYRQRSK